MYRIAVVDDEPNLVEGLCDLLTCTLLPEIEVFKAFSASDVLSLLMKTSLDVMISDIRMPGISGLDMLAWVEQFCPNCRVIFLTGYDTFAWVQEALRHPCCVDYLLKNQGDDAVIASVSKQLEHIAQEHSPEMLLRRVTAQMDMLRPVISRHALTQWLVGQGSFPAAHYRGTDAGKPTLLCLFRRAENGALAQMLHATLAQLCAENFLLFPQQDVIAIGWEEYVLLAQRGANDVPLDQTYAYVRARLENIQRQLGEMGETVSIAFREELFPLQDAPQYVTVLKTALAQKKLPVREMILEETSMTKSSYSEEKESSILQWIKDYVSMHIDDVNLSLTAIANDTYYAPAYLSRLFKAKVGMNFSVYVAKVRIQTACRLLQEGKMTAQQVGRSVGFESPSSFGAFFKRHMGMTPAQYMRDRSGR